MTEFIPRQHASHQQNVKETLVISFGEPKPNSFITKIEEKVPASVVVGQVLIPYTPVEQDYEVLEQELLRQSYDRVVFAGNDDDCASNRSLDAGIAIGKTLGKTGKDIFVADMTVQTNRQSGNTTYYLGRIRRRL